MALGGMVLTPATVLAEAPQEHKVCCCQASQINSSANDLQKKSIYDDVDLPSTNPAPLSPPVTQPSEHVATPVDEDQPRPHGPTPTDRLAVQIGHTRMALYRAVAATEAKLNETMDSAFSLEQSFTGTLASLAPGRETGEKLMPGAIYVLVAAMADSIITRNRNIVLRTTVPLAMGIGAGWTVLPVTMRNVSDLTWKYEQKVPAVADAHLRAREILQKTGSFAKVHKDLGARYVDEKVTDAREIVEGWVKQGK